MSDTVTFSAEQIEAMHAFLDQALGLIEALSPIVQRAAVYGLISPVEDAQLTVIRTEMLRLVPVMEQFGGLS